MSISVFDVFSIGIGPSSSHTVGPMKAAKRFLDSLKKKKLLKKVKTLKCDLYGSLALTGKGHGTDKALILGLQGYTPEKIDSDKIEEILSNVRTSKKLTMFVGHKFQETINFSEREDIKFHRRVNLPYHPNGMCIAAFDKNNQELFREVYYSIGGGFIVNESEAKAENIETHKKEVPYNFESAEELMTKAINAKLSIPELMMENEKVWATEKKVRKELLSIWNVMKDCVERGIRNEGTLPGGLKVKRRAPSVYRELCSKPELNLTDALTILDWVNLYALAVNEENAAGGQVVTAPTNGAAGIIPAILHYYVKFCPNASDDGVVDFLLTAGAIAILYKKKASISGAEVGCQGEVGVACSMAAGALTQVLGGTIYQVENAAEIAMEHNLGLTCDPIGGLVQIPCIERNAMGSIKAINASRMALRGNGEHFVSLDKVIATMKKTGMDMKSQYKETSRGGLAVNITEC